MKNIKAKSKKKKVDLHTQSLRKEVTREKLESLHKVFIVLFISFQVLLILWNTNIAHNWADSYNSRSNLTGKSLIAICVAYPIITFILLFANKFKRIENLSYGAALKTLRRAIIFHSILVAVIVALLLHGTGVIDKLTNLIFIVFPSVGTRLGNVLSTIIGWIASGVIGNFVYDVLKRRYLKALSTSKSS